MIPRSPSASGSSVLISAAATRNRLKLPIRLTSMTRRNASSGNGPSRPRIRPGVPTPAQLTAMRAGPCRWRAAATAVSTAVASVTLQPIANPPNSEAAVLAAASSRSRIVTLTRAAANAAAVARPSPEAPPLTIAACPSISMGSSPNPPLGTLAPRLPRRASFSPAGQPREPGLAMRYIDRRPGDDGGSCPGPSIGHLAEPQEADQCRKRQPDKLERRAGAGVGRGEGARDREMRDRAEAAEPEESGEG